jgi:phospholipid/cholesterol/gamma-HCH transport system substrate-binding protein
MTAPLPEAAPPLPPPEAIRRRAWGMLALLLGLGLAATLYLLYARGLFEHRQTLVLLADDAEGVAVGMDLTFAGFPIGRVERIALGPDGVVRMHVSVTLKNAGWLRTSSVVTMERSLVGGTRLRAYSGILDDPALPDGAEIKVLKGDVMAEIPGLVAGVREIVEQVAALTAPQSALAQSLNHVAATTGKLQGPQGGLGVLMGNEADARRVLQTLDQARSLLARLDAVALRTDGLMAKADDQVFGPTGLARDAQALLAELTTAVQAGQASLKRVDALLADAQAITGSTRDATADLVTLRAEVEASLRKLQTLMTDVQRRWPFGRSGAETQVPLP